MSLLDDDENQPNYIADLGLDNNQQPQYQVIAPVVQESPPELLQAQEESVEDEISVHLSEAEKKFAKADLYREWLQGEMYEGVNTLEVKEVEAEFKAFALNQLKLLLGLVPAAPAVVQAKSEFSSEQVTVLKGLADQILAKASLQKVALKPEPAKPVPSPPKPALVKPQAAAKPSLKPRRVPQEAVPAAPKPVASAPKPTPPKPAPPKPEPKSSVKPKATPGVKPADPTKIPQDGEMIEENGKIFQVSHQEISSAAYGPVEEKRIDKMAPMTAITLYNDIQVIKNAQGQVFALIKKDVTPRNMPAGAVPFPADMLGATMRLSEGTTRMSIAKAQRQ